MDWTESIEDIVIDVRKSLVKENNITDHSKNKNREYYGLCNEACKLLMVAIEMFNVQHQTQLTCTEIHGEQKHWIVTDPVNWPIEHTWAVISEPSGRQIYVDPTSQQFNDLYNDIPNYYISDKPPKWYYADRCNPRFSKKLSPKLRGIVDTYQYRVWATVVRAIRKILMLK